jgi:N-acetylglucosaminyl-diphospho-decaprenol L-rhamnosyltransferase
MKIFNDVTIIIVTYKSDKIIYETIDYLDKNFNIIISENSNRKFFKKRIENQFSNCSVILTGSNLGVSKAVNIALKTVKTKFSLFLTPDTFIKREDINKIYNLALQNKSAAIITPKNINSNFKNLYGFFDTIDSEKTFKNSINKNYIRVDWVFGGALLLNNRYLKLVNYFDENFFLDFEELDLCYRLRKKNYQIIFSKNALMSSKAQSSVSSFNKENIKYQRMWHYGWSSFYFYRKNFGFFFSIKKNFFLFIKNLFKMLIYFLLLNKKKSLNYFYYIFGFIVSLVGKKSYLRKKI